MNKAEKKHFTADYFVKQKINKSYKGILRFYKKPFLIRLMSKYIQNGAKVLEVSCGNAEITWRLSRIFNVTVVDISEWACEQAKVKTKKTSVVCADACSMPFKNNTFDGVIALSVLEHIKEVDKAIEEIKRVIASNGVLIVEVPNLESIGIKFKKEKWCGYRDTSHVSLLTQIEWIEKFRRNGFEIIDKFGNGLWDIPYFKYIPNFIQYLFIKIPSIILFELGFRFNLKWKISESIFFILRTKK
jgi:ubiquinone/menaquinone biosynthesis C-methylase UbiE